MDCTPTTNSLEMDWLNTESIKPSLVKTGLLDSYTSMVLLSIRLQKDIAFGSLHDIKAPIKDRKNRIAYVSVRFRDSDGNFLFSKKSNRLFGFEDKIELNFWVKNEKRNIFYKISKSYK